MPSPRSRRHLIVPTAATAEAYSPHDRSIRPVRAPSPPDRKVHAAKLTAELRAADEVRKQRREAAGIAVRGEEGGLYVEFTSPPGVTLKAESLENTRAGIQLVALAEHATADAEKVVQSATVFVPEGQLAHFFGRIEEYTTKMTPNGEPSHREMIDRIAAIRLASLAALWTDDEDLFPAEDVAVWWEVWLRRSDENELNRFREFAAFAGIVVGERHLAFADRLVALAHGTARQLAGALDVVPDLAELRQAKAAASFFDALPAREQAEWVADLVARTSGPPDDAPAVCILDTGINRGHPLLSASLAASDLHTYDPKWGTDDRHGHGTGMAGLALYGDFRRWLAERVPIQLYHRLESVKILPNPGTANVPELYGAIMVEAAGRVEIEAPGRRRCFALAVTADDQRDLGRPTSWSAAIDALAVGRTFDNVPKGLKYTDDPVYSRLFVVAGGNVDVGFVVRDPLAWCDKHAVRDPGQAWNALTVGACTDLVDIGPNQPDRAGWRALAQRGELSPFSTTSVPFGSDWPIKPEVVFEGGNAAIVPVNLVEVPVPDLSLLTTNHQPAVRSFDLATATSAASAQVARIAAAISVFYPELGPVAVRALIVHCAEWTPAMKARFDAVTGKRDRLKLLRRYGYGVPNMTRALRSAQDAVTLVIQGDIRPYEKRRMREMRIHALPWPTAVLASLGEERVRLRVTLSYFVEPNPARRGWSSKYRYASHALRFDVLGPTEDPDRFRKRLNKRALEDDEPKPSASEDAQWYLGSQARNKGSIHSDVWEGTASDLAARGHIAVYPVGGWWKDQPRWDRSEQGVPYALIVSIETTALEVDIWTPIAAQIGIPVDVEVL